MDIRLNRIRQRDMLEPAKISTQVNINGTPYYGESSYPDRLGSIQTIIDNGWSKCFKTGIYRNNPVDIRKISGSCSSGSVYLTDSCPAYYRNMFGFEYNGQIAAFAPLGAQNITLSASADGDAVQQASTQAHAKLGEPSVDVPLFLAEIGETVELIKSPVGSLTKAFKKFRRRPPKISRIPRRFSQLFKWLRTPSKSLSYFSDKWLEYRYGLMPLLLDVADATEYAANEFVDRRFQFQCKKGTIVNVDTVSDDSWTWYEMANLRFKDDHATTTMVVVGVYFYDQCNFMVQRLYDLGLSPHRILSLAYNLVPLSFMLDWAWNFNDWITGILPVPGRQPFDTYTSIVDTTVSDRTLVEAKGRYTFLNQYVAVKPSAYQRTHSCLLRSTGPPNLGISPSPPKDIFNLQRSLDSVSLAWNLLLKR